MHRYIATWWCFKYTLCSIYIQDLILSCFDVSFSVSNKTLKLNTPVLYLCLHHYYINYLKNIEHFLTFASHGVEVSQGRSLRGRRLSPFKLSTRRPALSAGAQCPALIRSSPGSAPTGRLLAQTLSWLSAVKHESVLDSAPSLFQAAGGRAGGLQQT